MSKIIAVCLLVMAVGCNDPAKIPCNVTVSAAGGSLTGTCMVSTDSISGPSRLKEVMISWGGNGSSLAVGSVFIANDSGLGMGRYDVPAGAVGEIPAGDSTPRYCSCDGQFGGTAVINISEAVSPEVNGGGSWVVHGSLSADLVTLPDDGSQHAYVEATF